MAEQKPQSHTTAHAPQRGAARGRTPQGGDDQRGGGFERNRRERRPRRDERQTRRARPEFEQKIIDIRRVTRVVAGGRRFSFSVAIVAGNRKGTVGVGIGKASDTALAIEKAMRDAKKQMITPALTKEMSIGHNVEAKFNSARIMMMPTGEQGIVAGSSVRTVLELMGAKGITAKVHSKSKNKLNIARATIKALSSVRKREVAKNK